MKRSYVLGGIAAAAVLAVGGFGIDAALAAAPAPAPAAPGVHVGTDPLAPGTALVDGTGRALYLFEADAGTMSNCTGVCAQVWPPVLTDGGAPAVDGAAQAQLVGSTLRADGTRQLTYGGHPLYTFTGDRAPGETRGQGLDRFGAPWYVVAPTGAKIDPDDDEDAGPAPAPAPAPAGY